MADSNKAQQVYVLTGVVPWTEEAVLLGVYPTYEAATAAYRHYMVNCTGTQHTAFEIETRELGGPASSHSHKQTVWDRGVV